MGNRLHLKGQDLSERIPRKWHWDQKIGKFCGSSRFRECQQYLTAFVSHLTRVGLIRRGGRPSRSNIDVFPALSSTWPSKKSPLFSWPTTSLLRNRLSSLLLIHHSPLSAVFLLLEVKGRGYTTINSPRPWRSEKCVS